MLPPVQLDVTGRFMSKHVSEVLQEDNAIDVGAKPRNWMLRPLFYFTVFCIIVFACCRSPYWEQTQIVIFHTISVGPHKPFPILTLCFCIAQKEPWELPFKFPQKVLAESRDLK